MSSRKRGELLATQKALVELRTHAGLTQQQFAVRLDMTVTTVARWETCRPPRGLSLHVLANAAAILDRPDLEKVFQDALDAEAGVSEATRRMRTTPVAHFQDALARLFSWGLVHPASDPHAAKVVRQVVRVIADAHSALLEEAIAGRLDDRLSEGFPLEEAKATQLELDRLNQRLVWDSVISKKRNPNESK